MPEALETTYTATIRQFPPDDKLLAGWYSIEATALPPLSSRHYRAGCVEQTITECILRLEQGLANDFLFPVRALSITYPPLAQ